MCVYPPVALCPLRNLNILHLFEPKSNDSPQKVVFGFFVHKSCEKTSRVSADA